MELVRALMLLLSAARVRTASQSGIKANIVTNIDCNGQRTFECPEHSICSLPQGKCVCLPGFTTDGHGRCKDLDECAFTCDGVGRQCENTFGGFACYCREGFKDAGDSCEDVNECTDPASCGRNMDCRNTPGSFVCECHEMVTQNGDECPDVDPCLLPTTCPLDSTCIKVNLYFYCRCKPGFIQMTEFTCIDKDECLYNPCDRDTEVCQNNVGSYLCVCAVGYGKTANDGTCTDVDECQDLGTKACLQNSSKCKNTIGSYDCVDLRPGRFYGHGAGDIDPSMIRASFRGQLEEGFDKDWNDNLILGMVAATVIVVTITICKEVFFKRFKKIQKWSRRKTES